MARLWRAVSHNFEALVLRPDYSMPLTLWQHAPQAI